MKQISVALLSDNETAAAFAKYSDKSRFALTASFTAVPELTARLPMLERAFIVLDMTVIDKTAADTLISLIKSDKREFICIVPTAADGFSYMSKGALDMLVKNDKYTDAEYIKHICLRLISADEKYQSALARVRKYNGPARSDKIVLIGSSTGGAETVTHILKQLPADMPPIVVVQHMPPVFTNLYAERLNELCKLTVWEARDGDELMPGCALIAPGDYQVRLTNKSGKYAAEVYQGEKMNGHAPSADVLFFSGAALLGKKALGVILTGMGRDGAAGLLAMRNAGAYTIGQDAASCVVYGMPKAAYDMGAVAQQAHFEDIARIILDNL